MTVNLVYKRHMSEGRREHDNVDDAVEAAFWMLDSGEAYPTAVEDENGVVLLTEKELFNAQGEYMSRKGL